MFTTDRIATEIVILSVVNSITISVRCVVQRRGKKRFTMLRLRAQVGDAMLAAKAALCNPVLYVG